MRLYSGRFQLEQEVNQMEHEGFSTYWTSPNNPLATSNLK